MTARVEILETAVLEARDARAWYAERDEEVATRFVAAIEVALARIAAAPLRYPPHLAGTRRCAVGRFPYWAVHRGDVEAVVVVAFAHTSRRPGYWDER